MSIQITANDKGIPVQVEIPVGMSYSAVTNALRDQGWVADLGDKTLGLRSDTYQVTRARPVTADEADPRAAIARAAAVEADAREARQAMQAERNAQRGRGELTQARRAKATATETLLGAGRLPVIPWDAVRERLAHLQATAGGNDGDLRRMVVAASRQPRGGVTTYEGLCGFLRSASGTALANDVQDAVDVLAFDAVRHATSSEGAAVHAFAAALAEQVDDQASFNALVRQHGLGRDGFARALVLAYANARHAQMEDDGTVADPAPMDSDAPMGPDAPMDPTPMDPAPMDPTPMDGDLDEPDVGEPIIVEVPDPHDPERKLEVSVSVEEAAPETPDAIDDAASEPLPADAPSMDTFEVSTDDEDGQTITAERFKARSLEAAERRVAFMTTGKRVSAGIIDSPGNGRFTIARIPASRKPKVATLTADDVEVRCAALGLNPARIEADVVNGTPVEACGFRIALTGDTDISMGRIESRVPRVTGMTALNTQIADFRRHVATAARGAYTITASVPGGSIAERRAAIKTVVAAVTAVAQHTGYSANPNTGLLAISFAGHPPKDRLTRIATTLQDQFGLAVEGQYQPFNGPAPTNPPSATPAPNLAPAPVVDTSSAAQQQVMQNGTNPMDPSRLPGMPGVAPTGGPQVTPMTPGRTAQEMPPMGGGGAEEGAPPSEGAGAGAGAGEADLPPAMGGDVAPAAGAPQGGMSAPERESVYAALMTFRNEGMSPLTAQSKFLSKFSDTLDKFGPAVGNGDASSVARNAVEADIMGMVVDLWSKPAVLGGQMHMPGGMAV